MDIFKWLTGTPESEKLVQTVELTENQGIQLLNQINWDIRDKYLATATIKGRYLTPAERRILDIPIQLNTSNLILKLRLSQYSPEYNVEFGTGSNVTPLQILAAIHTYYAEPYTPNDLYTDDLIQVARQFPDFQKIYYRAEPVLKLDPRTKLPIYSGHKVLRREGMGNRLYYNRLVVNPDGSLYPIITGSRF